MIAAEHFTFVGFGKAYCVSSFLAAKARISGRSWLAEKDNWLNGYCSRAYAWEAIVLGFIAGYVEE